MGKKRQDLEIDATNAPILKYIQENMKIEDRLTPWQIKYFTTEEKKMMQPIEKITDKNNLIYHEQTFSDKEYKYLRDRCEYLDSLHIMQQEATFIITKLLRKVEELTERVNALTELENNRRS